MADRKFLVVAEWDEEAGVWVATSDDIPGLVTEARSLDELRERILAVVPELIEDNAHHLPTDDGFGDLVQICVESTFRIEAAHAR